MTSHRRVVLEVKDLSTQYFTHNGIVHAVNDVSMTVDEGKILALVGESGCGKSATALSIMRLISPASGRVASGEVWFEGRNLLEIEEREMRSLRGNSISMIFQDPMNALNPVLTVGQQIGEALRLHTRLQKTEIRRRTVELLELVGVPAAEKRIDDYPHEFSGGMRQRVMIAMALSCNPSVLIADEPTTALDVTIQAQILELLERLCRELRMAVILITHDLGVVATVADNVHVMYGGSIVESGSAISILRSPQHPYTQGLLHALPKVHVAAGERLVPIPGRPPDLVDLPVGCAFQPRCGSSIHKCGAERPVLMGSGGTAVACWVRQATGDDAYSSTSQADGEMCAGGEK